MSQVLASSTRILEASQDKFVIKLSFEYFLQVLKAIQFVRCEYRNEIVFASRLTSRRVSGAFQMNPMPSSGTYPDRSTEPIAELCYAKLPHLRTLSQDSNINQLRRAVSRFTFPRSSFSSSPLHLPSFPGLDLVSPSFSSASDVLYY